jgi:hypothetical protein
VRALRIRGWLPIACCLAITAAAYCTIHLRSHDHANSHAVPSAEDEVYEIVIRDLVTPSKERLESGPRITRLVFSDTLDTNLCPGVDKTTCIDGVHQQLRSEGAGAIGAETIEDFIERSQTAGPTSRTFHTDLPRDFIARDKLYFDTEPPDKRYMKRFDQLFSFISFSHVGFDSKLNEAIVSVSFVCNSLCGTGHRYILRRKWGRWEVVKKWIVWVS